MTISNPDEESTLAESEQAKESPLQQFNFKPEVSRLVCDIAGMDNHKLVTYQQELGRVDSLLGEKSVDQQTRKSNATQALRRLYDEFKAFLPEGVYGNTGFIWGEHHLVISPEQPNDNPLRIGEPRTQVVRIGQRYLEIQHSQRSVDIREDKSSPFSSGEPMFIFGFHLIRNGQGINWRELGLPAPLIDVQLGKGDGDVDYDNLSLRFGDKSRRAEDKGGVLLDYATSRKLGSWGSYNCRGELDSIRAIYVIADKDYKGRLVIVKKDSVVPLTQALPEEFRGPRVYQSFHLKNNTLVEVPAGRSDQVTDGSLSVSLTDTEVIVSRALASGEIIEDRLPRKVDLVKLAGDVKTVLESFS